MNQRSFRVGKCMIFCAFPVVCSVSILMPKAIAGGFDTPSYDENFPESLMGTQSKDSELNQTERVNSSTEEKKPTKTILPRTFDFDDWQQMNRNDGTSCKSDGFNTICLTPEQAESLAW